MEIYTYLTIDDPSEGLYKEKGSKFLSFAYPVLVEQEVKDKVQLLKKEFFDARHHCYGYVLNPDKSKFRAVDDGEPAHSAGDPILGQIRSRNLTNILVVVVRYFGGIKLGVGGLIHAYKAAADDALSRAKIIEREVRVALEIQYPYTSTPDVMKLVKEFELEIQHQSFEESCKLEVNVKLKLKNSFLEKIKLRNALGTPMSIKEIPLS